MFKKYYSLLIVSIFILTVLAPYTTNADVAPLDINSQIYTNYGGGASAPILTNTEALGDIQQAQRDASNLYNKAISSGVSKDVAQTQANKILQAGIDRAKVKQNNLGWLTKSNEATIRADQAYEKAQAEASAAVGDTKQAEYANAAAEGYKQVADNVARGNTTGSDAPADSFISAASAAFSPQGKVYTLLAPIETFFPGGTVDIAGKGLSGYLDGLYKAGIAIATGLALIMIVIGGLQYVSTDAIGGKSEGRQRINNAIVGLLLALGSYILLQQINPALLKSDLNVEATKSTGKVNNVDIELSTGTTAPPPDIREGVDVSQMPYTQGLLNNTGLQTLLPSGFKSVDVSNTQWRAYIVQQIQTSGLINFRPNDASRYFPNGQITVDGWVGIIGGMIKKESNFNPNTVFPEPPPLRYNSVGLLQLSAVDAEARAAGCNETCLKDPLNNIRIGIQIMVRQLRKDNCISCKSIVGNVWKGLSAYWSTIRF